MQKGTFDDVACNYLLLAMTTRKEIFGKQCRLSFLYHVRIKMIFLYYELSLLTCGVIGQMRILIHDSKTRVN